MTKNPKMKPITPIVNPDTGLAVNKNIFISISYVHGPCEGFQRIF